MLASVRRDVFASRLRVAIVRAGYNVRTLAQAASVGHCTLSRYQCGRQLPTPARLHQLATILAVDVDWLAGHTADAPIRLSL